MAEKNLNKFFKINGQTKSQLLLLQKVEKLIQEDSKEEVNKKDSTSAKDKNNKTCVLDFAIEAELKTFASSQAVQNTLTNIWCGKILEEKQKGFLKVASS